MVAPRRAEADVRGSVLAAATRLFAARGFEGTAVQDVADAVGVSKPAVLHHFPSKEALRQAVLDGILAHWKETLPRLLLAATATEDRFQAVFGELRRFFSDDPDRARLVLRELIDRPVELKKVLRAAVRPWLDAVAMYVRAGVESGRHHADIDPEAYVVHVMQLVIAAAASSNVLPAVLEGDSLARYDRELTRIARSSLFVSAGGSPPTSPRKRKSPR
jgi:TetR/AcrR family transcriptional regulator